MDEDRFESSLGEVAIGRDHIERDISDSSDWENIRNTFSESKLVEYAHFSDVEDFELDKGSVYPNIRLKVDGVWKRLFFHVGDEVEECLQRLNYRWRAYKQNY